MTTLVLLRHGQSQWNLEDRFTGWVGVDLSEEGEVQAVRAGELIKAEGFDFDRDRRYAGAPIPATESLKTTLERVLPYWSGVIAPRIAAGETILIAAHGNSIRAIVKHLFAVPDETITGVEIPTGNPLLLDLDAAVQPRTARYLDETRAEPLPPAP